MDEVLDDLLEMVDEVGLDTFCKMFVSKLIEEVGLDNVKALAVKAADSLVDNTESRLVKAGRRFIRTAAENTAEDVYNWSKDDESLSRFSSSGSMAIVDKSEPTDSARPE